MSRRAIDVYFDVTSRILRDATGAPLATGLFPYINLQESVVVRLRLVTDAINTKYQQLAVTQTFRASFDKFFDSATLMAETLNTGFNLAGDWTDGGTATVPNGELSIRINGDTAPFRSRIKDNRELAGTRLEITVTELDDDDTILVFSVQFAMRALGLVTSEQLSTVTSFNINDNWESFIGPKSGKQCFRLLTDSGEVMETFCPAGVDPLDP